MEPFVLQRTSGVLVRLGQMALVIAFGVLGLVVSDSPVSVGLAIALMAFGGFFAFRALRMQAIADDDGLHLQGAFRERVVPWEDIAGADVVAASMVVKTWHVRVVPTEGRSIHLADLYNFGRRRDEMPSAQMAAQINLRLRSIGRRPLDLG